MFSNPMICSFIVTCTAGQFALRQGVLSDCRDTDSVLDGCALMARIAMPLRHTAEGCNISYPVLSA